MPVTKLDLSSEKFSFLKPLVDGREMIVEEYNNMVNWHNINNVYCPNWNLMCLQHASEGKTENIKNFPTISNFIDNTPNNILLSFIAISEIDYGDTGFHDEQWTKETGYIRIHIPLINIDGASIIVIEDNGEHITYTYELDNAYQFENPFNGHKPSNFNKDGERRLMLMVDLVDKNINPDINELNLFDKYLIAHQEFTLTDYKIK